MSAGPDFVRVKRKRYEPAPEALLVERPGKRLHTPDIHYVLQKNESTDDGSQKLFDADNVRQLADDQAATLRPKSSHAPGRGLDAGKERRVFHLKRPSTPEAGVRKQWKKDDRVATFVERRNRRNAQEFLDIAGKGKGNGDGQTSASTGAFKRPGKGSSIRVGDQVDSGQSSLQQERAPANDQSKLTAMAESLHQFAMDEIASTSRPKPKVTAKPKLPSQRSKELHQERVSCSDAPQSGSVDVEMDDDADYVYDTYVLAPTPDAGAAQVDAQGALGNVGYLVITEEDQAAWETYIEDDPSDKDWDSDEDDENAEDWYGADYPDDEVASDDEFDRNAYGYRAHGSDDEEWDADTGNLSDDEYERQMNPWRKQTPQQFSKYFVGKEAAE